MEIFNRLAKAIGANSNTRQFPITCDEAEKRVTGSERSRMSEAFRKLGSASGTIGRQTFLREVLGDGVPPPLAEQIHSYCCACFIGGSGGSSGGGIAGPLNGAVTRATLAATAYGSGGASGGLNFKHTLALLVLLTRGSREEKIKFIFGLLSSGNGSVVDRGDAIRRITDWESGYCPHRDLDVLFDGQDKVSYEMFSEWMDKHVDCLGVSRWLLLPNRSLSLVNKADTLTFYQTLAGVTHLDESEIVDLEKRFWALADTNPSKRIDLATVRSLVAPPFPNDLVLGFFSALDENQDGHVDFKELSCGVSAACRGPDLERQKFCFKVFDGDKDGLLNQAEVRVMLRCMLEVQNQTAPPEHPKKPPDHDSIDKLESQVFSFCGSSTGEDSQKRVTVEEYLCWTVSHPELPGEFSRLIYQLCHVVIGLRPTNRSEEGSIVRGWLEREERNEWVSGSVWYLVSMRWWTQWHAYVNQQQGEDNAKSQLSRTSSASSSSSLSSSHVTGGVGQRPGSHRLESAVALSDTPSVVGTSYLQINHEAVNNGSGSRSAQASPMHTRKAGTVVARPRHVDNLHLVQPGAAKVTVLTSEGGKLRPDVQRGKDYELLPERLWNAVYLWYGGSPVLKRQVVRMGGGRPELELHPLSLKLLRHQTTSRPSTAGFSNAVHTAAQGAYGAAVASSMLSVPAVSSVKRYHAYQAAFSRRTTVRQIEQFLCGRIGVKNEDLRLWSFRDEASMFLLEDGGVTLEDTGFRDEDSILVEVRHSTEGTWPEEISSVFASATGTSSAGGADRRMSTMRSSTQVAGVTGLNNLGNTCYMNAAIQCVSNTKILATYFNSNCHDRELNRQNPLGYKGQVAKRFGDLVKEMWAAKVRSLAPIKMRWTIGHHNPSFAGFQQQDSQELLAFLMDGLHEDLNRVTDKKYVELKDSGGRPDIVVAQEAEDNHSARNKSIINDLFHGQLKSKVTCKVCGHESVKFDPFTSLSLPLPMDTSVHLEAIVILQDGSVPVKYGLSMEMEAKYSSIKTSLSNLCKVPPSDLTVVEVVQSQLRLPSSEEQTIKGMSGRCIFAYEIRVQPEQSDTEKQLQKPKSFIDIQRSSNSTKKDAEAKVEGELAGNQDEDKSIPPRETTTKGDSNQGGGNASDERSEDQMAPPSPTKKAVKVKGDTKEALLLGGDSSSGMAKAALSVIGGGGKHSRQSSYGGTNGSIDSSPKHRALNTEELADCRKGIIVGLHRKMVPHESYFLCTEKFRPMLFGNPIVLPCSEGTTYQDLYSCVWTQVSRLVTPLPPEGSGSAPGGSVNHAADCDDSLGYKYPFTLKVVSGRGGGSWCAWCPWHSFCRGCPLPLTEQSFNYSASVLAIDWDQTALHLRYLSAQEKAFVEDESVKKSVKAATESITLQKCLEAFTKQEELGQDEKYDCANCKKRQLASKKLQIWKLPPILVVHLKRFHCLDSGRWIKSHKNVDFACQGFDPTDFLAAIPCNTIQRYKELVSSGHCFSSIKLPKEVNGRIEEEDLSQDGSEADPVEGVTSPTQIELAIDAAEVAEPSNDQEQSRAPTPSQEETVSTVTSSIDPVSSAPVAEPSSLTPHPPISRRRIAAVSRTRQESTSLHTHPIKDDDLQDFHQHRLLTGYHSLDVKYNLYGMVCHTGVLGCGHYVAYGKMCNDAWWCLNDSSCKEVSGGEANIDKSNAYLLFFEREGLDPDAYLPKFTSEAGAGGAEAEATSSVTGGHHNNEDLDEDEDDDFKKQCSLM